jgi:hypothetical protein
MQEQLEKPIARMVSQAFLIVGGTESDRQSMYRQLRESEAYLTCSSYRGTNDELAVIFFGCGSDFKDMTFDEAKALAGSQPLTPITAGAKYLPNSSFGVIELTSKSLDSLVATTKEKIRQLLNPACEFTYNKSIGITIRMPKDLPISEVQAYATLLETAGVTVNVYLPSKDSFMSKTATFYINHETLESFNAKIDGLQPSDEPGVFHPITGSSGQ